MINQQIYNKISFQKEVYAMLVSELDNMAPQGCPVNEIICIKIDKCLDEIDRLERTAEVRKAAGKIKKHDLRGL